MALELLGINVERLLTSEISWQQSAIWIFSCTLHHGTIIRTGIACKKILLQKSIEFDIPLK